MEYVKESSGKLVTKLNGKYHSYNDMPASIHVNGDMYWLKNGLLHRDDDKPAIINTNGRAEWWVDGKFVKTIYNYKPMIKSARNF